MENCLLCLELNKEFVDSIKVNSTQWQEQNVKNLIDKHLWPMEIIQPSSCLCAMCWQELSDFHKFYIRIEEAHFNLGTLIKSENGTKLTSQKHHFDNDDNKNQEDCKELLLATNVLVENHLEPEILMENPLSTEFMIEQERFIKTEQDGYLSSEDMPLKQRRKRGRPPKDLAKDTNKDPLKKTKKSKPYNKAKKLKESSLKIINNQNKTQNSEEYILRSDLEDLEASKEPNISLDAMDNDGSDRESEYHCEMKPSKSIHKKKRNPDEKTRREHDKIIAENFQIFCNFCQIPIDNFIALRKHFRVEHNRRGFVICCKRKIFTRPDLVDHIQFHLDPDHFKCKKCGKVLSERSTLESHMKTHEEGPKEKLYSCDICEKSFKENATLDNHKLTHSADYEKKYSCTECGKFFTTLYSLNYHIQAIHHNKFVKVCDICGKTMRCRNSFKLHMERHENKDGTPINCEICGLRLVDRRGLRRHKNSQHPVGGKKEYSCHICSKVSPNRRALRTHIRFAHETGYIHKCTMCDKAFKRPEALREHMATHTGTALYSCPWCPKTFISNGNMHNHRKKAHPREWEEAQLEKYSGKLPTNYKPPVATSVNNLL